MTEDTTPDAAPATTDERIAKALERIADCLEAVAYGEARLQVWVEHVSDAGEADDGSTLGYVRVVTRDAP
jgi:hypothetical protein